ncbi:hypothetical protein JF66_11620 [Cryobacterium sp. MLB-32]|uniref:hypothetical protein n=1 Tax=Cryobacterium sp. MLB-32 TaxID=1529318 RepID=UPI0004E79260|nr:hypothetical protein [Cryobacterium sp. MLB-32]KFF59391.1 hypothetical protein JF66_11620 [Cryobacterium sp. MLB-32]
MMTAASNPDVNGAWPAVLSWWALPSVDGSVALLLLVLPLAAVAWLGAGASFTRRSPDRSSVSAS